MHRVSQRKRELPDGIRQKFLFSSELFTRRHPEGPYDRTAPRLSAVRSQYGSCTGFDLISRVNVRMASISDVDFLQNGIEKSQEVFPDKMEAAHVDGPYHSARTMELSCTCMPYKGQKEGISSIFPKIVNMGKYPFLNGAQVSVCFN